MVRSTLPKARGPGSREALEEGETESSLAKPSTGKEAPGRKATRKAAKKGVTNEKPLAPGEIRDLFETMTADMGRLTDRLTLDAMHSRQTAMVDDELVRTYREVARTIRRLHRRLMKRAARPQGDKPGDVVSLFDVRHLHLYEAATESFKALRDRQDDGPQGVERTVADVCLVERGQVPEELVERLLADSRPSVRAGLTLGWYFGRGQNFLKSVSKQVKVAEDLLDKVRAHATLRRRNVGAELDLEVREYERESGMRLSIAFSAIALRLLQDPDVLTRIGPELDRRRAQALGRRLRPAGGAEDAGFRWARFAKLLMENIRDPDGIVQASASVRDRWTEERTTDGSFELLFLTDFVREDGGRFDKSELVGIFDQKYAELRKLARDGPPRPLRLREIVSILARICQMEESETRAVLDEFGTVPRSNLERILTRAGEAGDSLTAAVASVALGWPVEGALARALAEHHLEDLTVREAHELALNRLDAPDVLEPETLDAVRAAWEGAPK